MASYRYNFNKVCRLDETRGNAKSLGKTLMFDFWNKNVTFV